MFGRFLAALRRGVGLVMRFGGLSAAGAMLGPLACFKLTLQQRRAVLVTKELRIAHFLAAARFSLAQGLRWLRLAGGRLFLRLQRGLALAVSLQLSLAEALAPL